MNQKRVNLPEWWAPSGLRPGKGAAGRASLHWLRASRSLNRSFVECWPRQPQRWMMRNVPLRAPAYSSFLILR